jgi:hypothetical protein
MQILALAAALVLLAGTAAAQGSTASQENSANLQATQAPIFPASDPDVTRTLRALHARLRTNNLYRAQGQFGRLADLFIYLADPQPYYTGIWDILQQAPQTAGGVGWSYWAAIAIRARLSLEDKEVGRHLLETFFDGAGVEESHPSVASLKRATAFMIVD